MYRTELENIMAAAVEETLEAMFFTSVEGDAAEPGLPAAERICAGVQFTGNPGGRFVLVLAREAAWALAGSFLGEFSEQDLSPRQVHEVVRELANILCGSILSRIGKETDFHLGPPELDCTDPLATGMEGIQRLLRIPEGALAVWLSLDGDNESAVCR